MPAGREAETPHSITPLAVIRILCDGECARRRATTASVRNREAFGALLILSLLLSIQFDVRRRPLTTNLPA